MIDPNTPSQLYSKHILQYQVVTAESGTSGEMSTFLCPLLYYLHMSSSIIIIKW